MCMLIYRPAGLDTKISAAWFDDFWEKNPDGFGAFWREESGALVVERTQDKELALKLCERVCASGLEAGLHWRHATSGTNKPENVHPFVVTKTKKGEPGLVMAHNGVMAAWQQFASEPTGSDTVGFLEKVVVPLAEKFGSAQIYEPDTTAALLIEAAMGSNNRLLFAHPTLGFLRYGDWWSDPQYVSGDERLFRGMYVANGYAWSSGRYDKEEPKAPFDPNSGSAESSGNVYGYWQNGAWIKTSTSGLVHGCDAEQSKLAVWAGPFVVGAKYPTREGGVCLVTEDNGDQHGYPLKCEFTNPTGNWKHKSTLSRYGWYSTGGNKSQYDVVGGPILQLLAPPQCTCLAAGVVPNVICPDCENEPAAARAQQELDERRQRAAHPTATITYLNGASRNGYESFARGQSRDLDEPVVDGFTARELLSQPDWCLEEWCKEEPWSAAEAIKNLCWAMLGADGE